MNRGGDSGKNLCEFCQLKRIGFLYESIGHDL
jgi:hypothetical protein